MPGTDYDAKTGAGTNYLRPFMSGVKSLASAGMRKLGLGGSSPQTMTPMGPVEKETVGRGRTYKGDSGDVDVIK
jgi:hypothetical protein